MTRKSLCVILLLSFSGFVPNDASVVWREYTFKGAFETWNDVQVICRGEYGQDLATIYTQADEGSMIPGKRNTWIGYYKAGPNWHWCQNSGNDFKKWANNDPDGGEHCAVLSHSDEKMHSAHCWNSNVFICEETSNQISKYIYVLLSKNWYDADEYCQNHHDDLAVFRSDADIDRAVNAADFPIWIGLHKEADEWKWNPGEYKYRNWAPGEPGNGGDCVSISSKTKEMTTRSCSVQLPFFCLKHNVVLVNENKTWEEALDHCRSISDWYNFQFDLVSVTPDDDFIWKVIEEAITEEVWVGLRFMAGNWLWVDRKDLLFDDQPVCPEESLQCGTISKTKTSGIDVRDCREKRSFVCYGS